MMTEYITSDAEQSNTGKTTALLKGNRAQVVGDELLFPPDQFQHRPNREWEDLTVADALEPGLRGWGIPPRPRLLPAWREAVASCWRPEGPFTMGSAAIKRLSGGMHDYVPRWENETMLAAQLWFVGAPMCDLLDGAAPSLPPTVLSRAVMPDDEGMVFFEAPLAGIDAEGSDHSVTVGAYLWGRAVWRQPSTGKERPIVGVSIYGPSTGVMEATLQGRRETPIMLVPLGGLIWPFGESCDFQAFGGNARDLSMREDRRRLLALWLLSSQPSLTSTTMTGEVKVTSKAKAKRIAAGKATREPPVRVVQLRRQPQPDADAPERAEGGRTYRHRWTVSGHWRNQAVGPARSQRRPTYINAYLKGPDTAPLLRSEKVKAWTR